MSASQPPRQRHLAERAVEALAAPGVAPKTEREHGGLSLAERAMAALPLAQPPRPASDDEARPPAGARDAEPDPPPPRVTLAQLEKAGLSASGAWRSRLSEEIGIVQYQILRTAKGMPPGQGHGIVMVTSARPNEGKSFCALNIAAGIALHRGGQVILVDTDSKRMSMTEMLECQAEKGLRGLSAEPSRPVGDFLLTTEIRNLSFLPFGTPGSGNGTLRHGGEIGAAIQRLANALPNHIIVLDTPPCLSTSDPSTLAGIAGQVVMVVRAEDTRRTEVEAALDMVDSCEKIQLLLNRVELTASDTFGAYGSYGGHGYYGADKRD